MKSKSTRIFVNSLGSLASGIAVTAQLTFVFVFLTGLLSSCNHKDLYEPDAGFAKVNVVFDWSKAPGATAKGMALYLFPENGGEMIRYDFGTATGGTADIPYGNYRALFVNNDASDVLLRGTEGYETLEAYTRPSFLLEPLGFNVSPKEANPNNEAVALAANRVWMGRDIHVQVFPPTTGNNGVAAPQTLVFYPEEVTTTYTVEIRNVTNVKYVSAQSLSLSGLSGNYFPATTKRSALRTTIPFEAQAYEQSHTIMGQTYGFGSSLSSNKMHTLALYVILTNGSKHFYSFDVSKQVNEAPDPRNVHILISGLNLPQPIDNGGAFNPTVGDWIGEEVDIDL
ncbi:UNVERIFIED_CONTAM: DUF5119 domain-containing protein [Prevotella sp. 15_C9]